MQVTVNQLIENIYMTLSLSLSLSFLVKIG